MNTKRNQTFFFNISNITAGVNPSTSRYFDTKLSLYFPQSDILLVGGNGLIAIINATRNYDSATKFIFLFNPEYWTTLALTRINNDSFVASFSDLNSYGSSGRLVTYNLTTLSRISDKGTSNFPQNLIVLNETTLINQYYYGLNEQIVTLPNLTITNNITLDRPLQPMFNGIVTNNASSYYLNTQSNGLFFLSNITNNVPTFNFG